MAELRIRRGSIEMRVDQEVNGKKIGVETRIVGLDYDDLHAVTIELDESAAGDITPRPEIVVDFKGKKPKKQKLHFDPTKKKYQ